MRRAVLLAVIGIFAASPAFAGTVLLRSGVGRDCYEQTLLDALTLNAQKAIAICSADLNDPDIDDYNRAATLINRADLRLRVQDYVGAAADADRSMTVYANIPAAYVNRGAAMIGLKRYDEAVTALDKALALNADKPELVYFNRALAKENMGDIRGAYYDYLKASQINPKFEPATQELTRFQVTPG